MSDPHTIVVLGAASAIAQAYARRRAAAGNKFVLLGRREDRLAAVAADLIARGAASAEPVVMDLSAIDEIERTVEMIHGRFGPPREIVVAYGTLGEQAALERDFAAARRALDVNFTSAALWLLAFLKRRDATSPLTAIVIGSVAGILIGDHSHPVILFIKGSCESANRRYQLCRFDFQLLVGEGRINRGFRRRD